MRVLLVADDRRSNRYLPQMPARGSSRHARSGLRAYLVVSSALFALMVGQTVNRMWSTPDFWVYLGAVREFAQRPLHPLHPLLVGNGADPYMGPYTLMLGLVSRVSGIGPVYVLAVAGLLNLLLLIFGIWQLTVRFSKQALAPPLALLFTLVAWGWAPWRWSGYFNLNSIGSGLPLGSTFASGLGLVTIVSLVDWLRDHQLRHLWMLGLGYPMVVLTHQMTGLWVGLIGLGIAVGYSRTFNRRRAVLLALVLAAAAVAIIAWPHFSILDLLTDTGSFDDINRATYRRVAIRSVLALPGCCILASRLVRRRRDPLAFGAVVVAVVFIFGWVTDRGSLGRVFPGLILMAHVTMADWFATRISAERHSTGSRSVARAAVVVILTTGLLGTATGWIRGIPRAALPSRLANDERLQSAVEPYLGFAGLIDSRAVVAAPASVSLAIGATTAKVIGSTTPAPFVKDNYQRLADVTIILDPDTPPMQRLDLMAKYHCEWLVVDSASADPLLRVLPDSEIVGTTAGYTVIRLRDSPDG